MPATINIHTTPKTRFSVKRHVTEGGHLFLAIDLLDDGEVVGRTSILTDEAKLAELRDALDAFLAERVAA